jgi:peptide/nickel transport system permease protein
LRQATSGRIDRGGYLLTCQLALPGLLLAMSLVFLIGPSVTVVICVIGVLHWTYFLVVTRAATMQIRELDYVTAARALGCTRGQVISHEVLPNLLNRSSSSTRSEWEWRSSRGVALVLGWACRPRPIMGIVIAEGRTRVLPMWAWWCGLFLFALVIAINLMGDGLRDVTAPENRN